MGMTVAVWGGSGSGKTSFSVKLAQCLTEREKQVILLLADRITPSLPCLADPRFLTNKRSLGSVLAAPVPSEALIRFHLIGCESDPRLSILGLLKGESAGSYPEPRADQVEALLRLLREMADVVIADCCTALSWDALSLTAVRQADHSLCLMMPELKTVSYLSSQFPLVNKGRDEGQRQWKLLNQPAEEGIAAQAFVDSDFDLPYCRELAEQSVLGELLQPLGKKAGRHYLQALSAFAEELLANNIE